MWVILAHQSTHALKSRTSDGERGEGGGRAGCKEEEGEGEGKGGGERGLSSYMMSLMT